MTDVRRERIPLLWSTVGETALARDVFSNMGIRSVRVSAEEQSCLEGVYLMRKSYKQPGDESEKKL